MIYFDNFILECNIFSISKCTFSLFFVGKYNFLHKSICRIFFQLNLPKNLDSFIEVFLFWHKNRTIFDTFSVSFNFW